MMRNREGSVLIIVVVMAFIMSALAAVLLTSLQGHGRTSAIRNDKTEVQYGAEAGIQLVKSLVSNSAYGANGNTWLWDNASPDGFLAFDNIQVGSALVDVTITDNGDGTCTTTSQASVGSVISQISFTVRDRDFFSKYMFFVHLNNINMGTTTVRGDVHSNRAVNFYYGGAHMFGDVTACRGMNYYYGASTSNTSFYADVDGNAESIAWPVVNEIATLHDTAEDVYQVSNASAEYSGFGNFDTEIEFDGDSVTITAKKNGAVLKTGDYPLPGNGLIFVQGNVTSLKGDIDGRVTVATMGKVDITGNLRYVDEEGDRAQILTDADGNIVENTPPGVKWTEADGYYYVPNPDYDPVEPSVVGIMAAQDVTITEDSPYNMEMHAALFSAQGNWHCDLSTQKGNLKVLGSMSHKTSGWRYSGTRGWSLSGEYTYDTNLLSNPPPHFLLVDKPSFGAWRLDL